MIDRFRSSTSRRGAVSVMALTPSTMLPLGTPLPLEELLIQLTPVCGGPLTPATLIGRPVLLLFLCPHCPFVHHIEPELSRLERDYGDRIALIGINSNSERTHPQDGPAGMTAQALRHSWRFPYLQDRSQAVARTLQAACTPDPFLYDIDHRLVYRGQIDASRPGNALPRDGHDLRLALDAVLAALPVSTAQTASIGCNIKWHPGQEPPWAR